jgi:mRNA-degrading endonuclease toxin of MazEF toxin-antitoxin module
MKRYELWWATLPAPAGRRPVFLLSRGEGLPAKCVANCDNIRNVPVRP